MKKNICIRNVRYAESDRMNAVYYANYLLYFEDGRLSYLMSKGIDYGNLEKKWNIGLPVVKVFCSYTKPLRFGDVFEIHTWVEELSNKLITFHHEIVRDKKSMAKGHVQVVFCNLETGRIVSCPDEIFKNL
jgi:acyl-CoA thioester hydrolase